MKKRLLHIALITFLFQSSTYAWEGYSSSLAYCISGIAIGAGTVLLIYKTVPEHDFSTIMAGSMCISGGLTLFALKCGAAKANLGTILASSIISMTVPTLWENLKPKPKYGSIRVLSLSLLLSSAALFYYANQ